MVVSHLGDIRTAQLVEYLSDAERRQADYRARRDRYLDTHDYRKWKRLERLSDARFRKTVDDAKPLFDLLRMVITDGILGGAILLLWARKEGLLLLVLLTPVCFLLAIAWIPTWKASKVFASLTAYRFAIDHLWPYKRRQGNAIAALYLWLAIVQILVLSAILILACLVGNLL